MRTFATPAHLCRLHGDELRHPPATYFSAATTSMGGGSTTEGCYTAAIPSRGDPSRQPRAALLVSPLATQGLRRRYPFPPSRTCARLRLKRLNREFRPRLDLELPQARPGPQARALSPAPLQVATGPLLVLPPGGQLLVCCRRRSPARAAVGEKKEVQGSLLFHLQCRTLLGL